MSHDHQRPPHQRHPTSSRLPTTDVGKDAQSPVTSRQLEVHRALNDQLGQKVIREALSRSAGDGDAFDALIAGELAASRAGMASVGPHGSGVQAYGSKALDDVRTSRPTAPADAAATLRGGSGQPIPAGMRQRLESAMGHSFADVRLHTDTSDSVRALGAEAATVGNAVHFAEGKLDLGSRAGQELLAHEIAHVVQGREGHLPKRSGTSDRGMVSEIEARSVGAQFAQQSSLMSGVTATEHTQLEHLKQSLTNQFAGDATSVDAGSSGMDDGFDAMFNGFVDNSSSAAVGGMVADASTAIGPVQSMPEGSAPVAAAEPVSTAAAVMLSEDADLQFGPIDHRMESELAQQLQSPDALVRRDSPDVALGNVGGSSASFNDKKSKASFSFTQEFEGADSTASNTRQFDITPSSFSYGNSSSLQQRFGSEEDPSQQGSYDRASSHGVEIGSSAVDLRVANARSTTVDGVTSGTARSGHVGIDKDRGLVGGVGTAQQTAMEGYDVETSQSLEVGMDGGVISTGRVEKLDGETPTETTTSNSFGYTAANGLHGQRKAERQIVGPDKTKTTRASTVQVGTRGASGATSYGVERQDGSGYDVSAGGGFSLNDEWQLDGFNFNVGAGLAEASENKGGGGNKVGVNGGIDVALGKTQYDKDNKVVTDRTGARVSAGGSVNDVGFNAAVGQFEINGQSFPDEASAKAYKKLLDSGKDVPNAGNIGVEDLQALTPGTVLTSDLVTELSGGVSAFGSIDGAIKNQQGIELVVGEGSLVSVTLKARDSKGIKGGVSAGGIKVGKGGGVVAEDSQSYDLDLSLPEDVAILQALQAGENVDRASDSFETKEGVESNSYWGIPMFWGSNESTRLSGEGSNPERGDYEIEESNSIESGSESSFMSLGARQLQGFSEKAGELTGMEMFKDAAEIHKKNAAKIDAFMIETFGSLTSTEQANVAAYRNQDGTTVDMTQTADFKDRREGNLYLQDQADPSREKQDFRNNKGIDSKAEEHTWTIESSVNQKGVDQFFENLMGTGTHRSDNGAMDDLAAMKRQFEGQGMTDKQMAIALADFANAGGDNAAEAIRAMAGEENVEVYLSKTGPDGKADTTWLSKRAQLDLDLYASDALSRGDEATVQAMLDSERARLKRIASDETVPERFRTIEANRIRSRIKKFGV